MLALERRDAIISILTEQGIVKVETLASMLGVSEMTIRRDLEKCEKLGLVHRCHGGAVLKKHLNSDISYVDKQVQDIDQKSRIADYCMRFVKENSTIYLDAGTTVYQMAARLVDYPGLRTIITNDLAIAGLLSEKTAAQVIIIGGVIQNGVGCIHGYTAEDMLKSISIDIAFCGGTAVDENFDLFSTSEQKSYYKRRLLNQSSENYLMIDNTKFFRSSLFKTHNLSEYTAVVSDRVLIDEERQFVEKLGINFITI